VLGGGRGRDACLELLLEQPGRVTPIGPLAVAGNGGCGCGNLFEHIQSEVLEIVLVVAGFLSPCGALWTIKAHTLL
jgi:hypothetical protein